MESQTESPGALAVKPPLEKKRAPTLYLIIGIKLVKGLLLLLLAVGVYLLRNKDLQEIFDHSLRVIHLDPEKEFFSAIGDKLDTITPANVKWVALVTCLYGTLLLVEGVGLAFHARWAVWLVIGQSAFFMPIEIYELIRQHHGQHSSWPVLVVMAINILIVWYLLKNRSRLFPVRHHH